MKKHILTALALALVAPCAGAAGEGGQGLGKVMFVGNSITHGINTGSYRWDFHKIMVDNGVRYQETGYNSGKPALSVSSSGAPCKNLSITTASGAAAPAK
ncbi:MAG: hypothetical protein MJ058_05625 [Akkermansia sp.]|nr:hypothetical protein [Akkermansia sp.]